MLDPSALAEVGFPALCGALAARARTPMGKARCLALPLLAGRAEVDRHLAQVEEARARLRAADAPPLADLGDVGAQLARAERSGLLEGPELSEVAGFARACSRLRGWLDDRAPQMPLGAPEAEALADLPALAAQIDMAIEPGGRIADRASPPLAQARDRVRLLRRQLEERLQALLDDERIRPALREGYLTVRGDRYCLPVKAQARGELPGIVHNASQSGQTLFVEPQSVVGLGNELAIARSMVVEEEQRILLALTAEVARGARELRQSIAAAARIDELFAGAALSESIEAHRPEIVEARAPFAFEALRHPLLVLDRPAGEVVASDVLLPGKARGLVVSGPNAGGKTVTLTAIGLCAAMARAGLPVPAGPLSRVPLFSQLFAAMGDAQDLARGLSTFGAHVTALAAIVGQAGPGSLVLIDEIAADTDPHEGAALAIAILEALVQRGATVVATTHLDPLKALGLADPRFANAAVGFDPVALAPTFQVTLGAPGRSSAIEVARRCGLPPTILARARAVLSEEAGPLPAALAALDEERRRLSGARAEVEAEAGRQADRARALAAREEAVAEREAEAERGARKALLADLARWRAEIAGAVAALEERATAAAAREAGEAVVRAQVEQERALAAAAGEEALPAAPGAPLSPGRRVRSRRLGREGEVIAIEGETAVVAVGGLKIREPAAELVLLPGQAPKGVPAGLAERSWRAEAAPAVSCDLRGRPVEGALREAERFLDRAYAEGAAEVLLVHGLGSGALRSALQRLLSASPYVRSFHPAGAPRGGEGTMVVELGD